MNTPVPPTDGPDLGKIASELDAAHERARVAFGRKDLDSYIGLFAPEVRYRQLDGVVIDRDRLARNVRDQFARVRVVRSEFRREHIELFGGRAIEAVRQLAEAHASGLFILHRTWDITRRSRYAWKRAEEGWVIEAVDVLEEVIRPRGVTVGFRPPSPG